jgi:hypothetical protein
MMLPSKTNEKRGGEDQRNQEDKGNPETKHIKQRGTARRKEEEKTGKQDRTLRGFCMYYFNI